MIEANEKANDPSRTTTVAPEQRSETRVLVVLFIPSVERDGTTPIDQQHWVDAPLEMFGRVFGGATAYPKAKGIWPREVGLVVGDEYFAIQEFIEE